MATPLVDTFGRVHRDLRISVTDRCNFRCTYCMPEEGLEWLSRDEILTFEEIERLAKIMVEQFGVDSIRLTGGEPLVRANLDELVRRLAALGTDLAMTTNGSTLRRHAAPLKQAGLKRLNISLDSLDRDKFIELTRRDELEAVLDGIDAAVEAGFEPVKINCVVMRGINDDEIVDFARFGRDRGVVVRFIEWMPLDADNSWTNDRVMSQQEIVDQINEVYPLEPIQRGHEPAQRFRYLDGQGVVGVIASVTQAFCGNCDRVRLTAEGQLRNCLFSVDEFDLRTLLRGGADDESIAAEVARGVHAKWAGHQIGQVHFIRPHRSMSQIGG
ncbi:MAG: GTP 3',8-cyclase MoaA [Actinomycetota bacterium]